MCQRLKVESGNVTDRFLSRKEEVGKRFMRSCMLLLRAAWERSNTFLEVQGRVAVVLLLSCWRWLGRCCPEEC